jgi:hypothetical protein
MGGVKDRSSNKWEARFDQMDLFAACMPPMNFEGRTRVHTSLGMTISMIVYFLCGVYAFVKFRDLYEGNDPNVNNTHKYGMFSNEKDGFRLEDTDYKFKVAFAVKRMDSTYFLENRKYVEWEAVIVEGNLTHNNN